jgi:ribosomal protein L11 methyltransferase
MRKRNDEWLKISIPSGEDSRDALINYLFELGANGCEESADRLIAYFPFSQELALLREKIRNYVTTLKTLGVALSPESISAEIIPTQDWRAEWKKHFAPIEVSERLLIKPTWCDAAESTQPIIINIDPGMAFGTGNHATTRLILSLLDKHVIRGDSVLDVGTGTGILAIAAAKLGASPVYAFDIDATAVRTARENCRANRCLDGIFLWAGDVAIRRGVSFDLILANILSKLLTPLLPDLCAWLKPGGKILLAGMLREERAQFETLLKDNIMTVTDFETEDEWGAFAAIKE